MPLDIANQPDELRRQLKDARAAFPNEWDASKRLVSPQQWPTTVRQLRQAIEASLPAGALQEALLDALSADPLGAAPPLEEPSTNRTTAESLKALTGLPQTKALRALCVCFGLLAHRSESRPGGLVLDDHRRHRLFTTSNPFDLLLDCTEPSVLDLGAGDLSFIDALAQQYAPPLEKAGRLLTAHTVDRVQAGSALAPTYQVPLDRLRRLQSMPGLTFHHWADADMFALAGPTRPRVFLPRYDFVTCWAPANPTFAYEPSRLAASVIRGDLERTRGRFRQVRSEGEPALEVCHQGRSLLFPPWKFDIQGPLALLDLLSRLGTVGILGAVDDAVFWECLAQLVHDPSARPRDLILTPEVRRKSFGPVDEALTALAIGDRCRLETLTPLRQDLPRVLARSSGLSSTFGFSSIEIRRGALFPGMPASLTAQRYQAMTDEPAPWFLLMVAQAV